MGGRKQTMVALIRSCRAPGPRKLQHLAPTAHTQHASAAAAAAVAVDSRTAAAHTPARARAPPPQSLTLLIRLRGGSLTGSNLSWRKRLHKSCQPVFWSQLFCTNFSSPSLWKSTSLKFKNKSDRIKTLFQNKKFSDPADHR